MKLHLMLTKGGKIFVCSHGKRDFSKSKFHKLINLSIRISQLFLSTNTQDSQNVMFYSIIEFFIMAWQHYFGVSCQKYKLFCINIPSPPFIVFKCLTFFSIIIYKCTYPHYEKRTT